MSDPLDELAAPDVISSGGGDFGAFAVSRWPGLVRLAFGLGLGGIIAAAMVLAPPSTPAQQEPVLPVTVPVSGIAGPDGYALQVSSVTAHLRATLSDGSIQLVTPRVVDGRKYAAFVVGTSLRIDRLTWLDAAGQEIASTTALPRSGYTQFQP